MTTVPTDPIKSLDKAIASRKLCELHTHLMGMGSADFWVSRIMKSYLPRVKGVPQFTEEEINKHITNKMRKLGVSHKQVNISNFLKEKNLDIKQFCDDAVYPVEKMCTASGFAWLGNDDIEESKAFRSIEARLNLNSSQVKLIKNYIVFNLKNQTFNSVLGITNSDLLIIMKENENHGVTALIRNWFQFLGPGGEIPTDNEIRSTCKQLF